MVRRQQMADRALRPAMRSPGRPIPARHVEREFWRLIAAGKRTEEAAAGVGVSVPVGADQAVGAHQPGDAVAARPVSGPAQLAGDARCPVGAARVAVNLADVLEQLGVGHGSSRNGPEAPRVVPSLGFVLNEGDLLYLPRGTVHSARNLGSGTDLHATIGTHWPIAGEVLGDAIKALCARGSLRDHWEYGDQVGSLLDVDEIDEVVRLREAGRTLRWVPHPIGPAEATSNLIKRIKRIGFGFRRFDHYRIRVLLYCGRPNWDLLATITPR
jgi:hypothetical protein